ADGRTDLGVYVTLGGLGAQFNWYVATASGGFSPWPGVLFGMNQFTFTALVLDVNGDQVPDFVTYNYPGVVVLCPTIAGASVMGPGIPMPAGVSPVEWETGDVDGDGDMD